MVIPMSEELKFRKEVIHGMEYFGDIQPVEIKDVSTGFPDINFCLDGIEGNLELKVNGPNGFEIRPSQKRWFMVRIKNGGNCWFLLKTYEETLASDAFILVHGSKWNHLDENVTGWINHASKIWYTGINYGELVDLLRNYSPI